MVKKIVDTHHHVYIFDKATVRDVLDGTNEEMVVVPASLGSAAAYTADSFATAEQGRKAEAAFAHELAGKMARKDQVDLTDIKTEGKPEGHTVLSAMGWIPMPAEGFGDMKASLYDEKARKLDVYDMANMEESENALILTKAEREKIAKVGDLEDQLEEVKQTADAAFPSRRAGDLATKDKIDLEDIDVYGSPESNTFLSGDGWKEIELDHLGDMKSDYYDPDGIEKDVYDMANMKESYDALILTSDERRKIAMIPEGGIPAGPAGPAALPADFDEKLKDFMRVVHQNVQQGTTEILATYDPQNVRKDGFDMENMREGSTKLILTKDEREKIKKISDLDTKVKDVEKVAKSAEEKVNEAKQAADEAKASAAGVKATADAAKEAAENAKSAADDAKNKVGQAKEAADNAKAEADKANKCCTDLTEKVTAAEGNITKLTESSTKSQADITKNATDITKNAADIKTLQDAVTTLKPDILEATDQKAKDIEALKKAKADTDKIVNAINLSSLSLERNFLVPHARNRRQLVVKAGTCVRMKSGESWLVHVFDKDATVALPGSPKAGKDYFVSIDLSKAGALTLSETAPKGANVIVLGGCHTLCSDVGSIAGHKLNGYRAGDVLPQSVWNYNHRPVCDPAGMVYDPATNIWVDIYLVSGDGGNTKSANKTKPTNRMYYQHMEDLQAVKKTMLTHSEFVSAITGTPSGRLSRALGNTGGNKNSGNARIISAIGCEDGFGTMWQFIQGYGYAYYSALNQAVLVAMAGGDHSVADASMHKVSFQFSARHQASTLTCRGKCTPKIV